MIGKQVMDRIGQNVASTWGAECEDWEILENGNVRFYCIECGDRFYSDLTPDELEEYNY